MVIGEAPFLTFSRPLRGAILAGILVLAAALRLAGLASRPVWLDEANAILIAGESFTDMISRLRLDSSPPLYYLLLHAWMKLFGDGEVAVRIPSALAGVLTCAATWAAARHWLPRGWDLAAALLVALSPVAILHSQQARMYSLLPLLALLAVWLLDRSLEIGRTLDLVGSAAATLLALLLHNFALLLLPGLLLLVALRGAGGIGLRRLFLAALGVAAGYAAWIPVLLQQIGNSHHYAWFGPFWDAWGGTGTAWRSLLALAPGGGAPPYVGLPGLGWAGVASALLLLLLMAVALLAGPVSSGDGRAPLLAAVAAPALGGLAVSALLTPSYVAGRVDQMMLPPVLLLATLGLSRLPRWPALAGCMLLAGLSLAGEVQARRADGFAGARQAAGHMAQEALPGDLLVCTSLTRAPLEYALRRQGVTLEILSFPADTAGHLGSQDGAALLADPALLAEEVRRLRRRLQARAVDGRFFVALAEDPVNRALIDGLLNAREVTLLSRQRRYRQAVLGTRVTVGLYRLRSVSGSSPPM